MITSPGQEPFYGGTSRKSIQQVLINQYKKFKNYKTKQNKCFQYHPLFNYIIHPEHKITAIEKVPDGAKNPVCTTYSANKLTREEVQKVFDMHEQMERSFWNKQQYQQHKEKILEKRMERHDELLDYAKNYATHYREKNRDKINEKVDCQCGGKYTLKNKAAHFKSKKHKNLTRAPESSAKKISADK